EINFSEEQIQSSDALSEISQGNWEGCLRSETYTPEVMSYIDRFQPDFTAPSGESLRQVEFRMIRFLNETVLGLHEKLRLVFSSNQNDSHTFSQHNSHALTNSIHDQDGTSLHSNQWDSLSRNRPAFSRKKSGKSRLQFVTTTGDEIEDDIPSSNANHQNSLHNSNYNRFSSSVSCIGIFTHSVPIKCLLTGLLGCSPLMSHKFCVEDSSVTVLQHSLRTGWQIKKLNDTAHLRLL
ncbi:fructose-2,6-bisphosphatase, partial [Trifolium pratense]